MISNFCPKCGKALCICLFLGVPVIEGINSPPEKHCTAAQLCTARPLTTEPWSPDAPHHDYRTTNQPTIEPVVGMGASTGTAAPLPPGDLLTINTGEAPQSFRPTMVPGWARSP